jgi:hypothetical protein
MVDYSHGFVRTVGSQRLGMERRALFCQHGQLLE